MALKEDPTQVRKDEAHRRVAAQLRRDPSVIEHARARLDRWLTAEGRAPDPVLLEWKAAIDLLDPDELAMFLESRTPRARRMRISSPFLGLA